MISFHVICRVVVGVAVVVVDELVVELLPVVVVLLAVVEEVLAVVLVVLSVVEEVLLVVEVVEEGFCVVLVVVEDVEVLVVVDGQTGSKLSGILFRTQFLPCT